MTKLQEELKTVLQEQNFDTNDAIFISQAIVNLMEKMFQKQKAEVKAQAGVFYDANIVKITKDVWSGQNASNNNTPNHLKYKLEELLKDFCDKSKLDISRDMSKEIIHAQKLFMQFREVIMNVGKNHKSKEELKNILTKNLLSVHDFLDEREYARSHKRFKDYSFFYHCDSLEYFNVINSARKGQELQNQIALEDLNTLFNLCVPKALYVNSIFCTFNNSKAFIAQLPKDGRIKEKFRVSYIKREKFRGKFIESEGIKASSEFNNNKMPKLIKYPLGLVYGIGLLAASPVMAAIGDTAKIIDKTQKFTPQEVLDANTSITHHTFGASYELKQENDEVFRKIQLLELYKEAKAFYEQLDKVTARLLTKEKIQEKIAYEFIKENILNLQVDNIKTLITEILDKINFQIINEITDQTYSNVFEKHKRFFYRDKSFAGNTYNYWRVELTTIFTEYEKIHNLTISDLMKKIEDEKQQVKFLEGSLADALKRAEELEADSAAYKTSKAYIIKLEQDLIEAKENIERLKDDNSDLLEENNMLIDNMPTLDIENVEPRSRISRLPISKQENNVTSLRIDNINLNNTNHQQRG